ncbi:MAG: 5-methylcytosine-specific restriction endonuclease McrA [Oleiphilaceae bacterium]|jgi:5-methylcytosine-specific restriction endonuclease McrA
MGKVKINIKKAIIAAYEADDAHKDHIRGLRTITLFGKNSATYKFALTHALLNQKLNNSLLKYEDLQSEFVREFVNHYEETPQQFSNGKPTRFSHAVDKYLVTDKSDADLTQLCDATQSIWKNYVFDAFHNIGGGTIDTEWQLFEHDKKKGGIVLSDHLMQLLESPADLEMLKEENQARWKIVESAWTAGIGVNLVTYNSEDGSLSVHSKSNNRRIGLRTAVDSLLPYQKGKCFYCSRDIKRNANTHDDAFPDVDHFFAHSFLVKLKHSAGKLGADIHQDGIWNLVIACRSCNRGSAGKFERRSEPEYFQKLLMRNELFTEEHKHAFRHGVLETLGVQNKSQMFERMRLLWNEYETFPVWRPQFLFP